MLGLAVILIKSYLTPSISTLTFPRLHVELRESVEKQLHALPVASGVEGGTLEEEAVTRNLQEQIQLSEQVRMCSHVMSKRHMCYNYVFILSNKLVCCIPARKKVIKFMSSSRRFSKTM